MVTSVSYHSVLSLAHSFPPTSYNAGKLLKCMVFQYQIGKAHHVLHSANKSRRCFRSLNRQIVLVMDASRPLLAGDAGDDEDLIVRPTDCLSRYLSACNGVYATNGKTQRNGHAHDLTPYFVPSNGKRDEKLNEDKQLVCHRSYSQWPCWKWVFPERINDYEDFATSAQIGDIYSLRQTAREQFDPMLPGTARLVSRVSEKTQT